MWEKSPESAKHLLQKKWPLILLAICAVVLAACSRHHKPAPVDDRSWRKPVQDGTASRRAVGKNVASRIIIGPSYGKNVPEHVVVRKGETLYSISFRYNLDWKSVARVNGLKPPYTIYPGQRLKLAEAGKRGSVKKKHARSPRKHRAAPVKTPAKKVGKPGATGRAVTRPAVRKPAQGAPPNRRDETSPRKPPPATVTLKDPKQWQWPANGRLVSSFSSSDPARKGVVIAGRPGDAVKATADGVVVYAGDALKAYGHLVIIKHSETYLSAYGYNRRSLVREGQTVRQGQKIAEIGTSPSGKPGLKFEIRKNGRPVNPLSYLPKKGK